MLWSVQLREPYRSHAPLRLGIPLPQRRRSQSAVSTPPLAVEWIRTFDQGGNVFEWNEALVSSSFRGLRGGAWVNGSVFLDASFRDFAFPDRQDSVVGFRVANIPGPNPIPGDGKVDGLDYLIWATHFGDDPAQKPPGSPENGDFNDDGMVDGLDYLTWAGSFGQGPNDAVTIPEPTSLSLLVLAGVFACGVARRRR